MLQALTALHALTLCRPCGTDGDGSNLDLFSCQQLCLNDPQCVSLDFLPPPRNQANCFISYNRNSDPGLDISSDAACQYFEPLFSWAQRTGTGDCETHDLTRFPGYTVAATHVQTNYDAAFVVDGDPSTSWAYGGCDQAAGACAGGSDCACPVMSDRSSYPSIAVLLESTEVINNVIFSSGFAGAHGYHLTGGSIWYTTDSPATLESTWLPVGGLEFGDPVDAADVSSNSFRTPSHPDGPFEMSLRFSPIRATGLMLDIFETDASNNNVILTDLSILTACAGPPPESVEEGSEWFLVAEEAAGDGGNDDLRKLELDVPDFYRVRMEWGSADDFVEFDVPRGTSIFGDYVDPSIPLTNVETNQAMLQDGAVFCKMCSSSSAQQYGDTCWAVLPADEPNRDCGCNSGGWAGHGIYYGGFDQCNTCGCRTPNAFTGPKDNGQAKGGVPSAGLRIYVKSEQEWALEDLGAIVIDTTSDLSQEAPQCVGNLHNLMNPTPIHTCEGECVEDCQGDTRFMFGTNDPDQTILVDLGQERYVNRIGAEYSITDREVWEVVSFEVSIDDQDWYTFGSVGNDDDQPDIDDAEAWVSAGEPIRTRYVKFHFGGHSADWGGAGSGIFRLHVQLVGGVPEEHPWPQPLVAVDIDDTGAILVSGTSDVEGVVQGTPSIVEGPSGELDAVQFGIGSYVQLGTQGVDTDETWTIDCYIQMDPAADPSHWGTLTRGHDGDHQIIERSGGTELGGYENIDGRGFVGSGFDMATLGTTWHRLTAAAQCVDGACAQRVLIYYIDGEEVARTDYHSESDFFAIGNYQDGAQPWRGSIHHFRIYDEAFSPADLQGTDDPDSAILNAPRYTVATLSTTERPTAVTETRRSCSNAFADQHSNTDPVAFCAQLCYEDEDCNFFSAYPVTFRRPGRCCFYGSSDPNSAAEATPGGFYSILRPTAHGSGGGGSWADVMAHIAAEGCSWDDFSARLEAVDAACCSGDASCPTGIPSDCDFFCAEKYIPLYDRCHDLLVEMVGDQLPEFDGLVDTCLTGDADTIQDVFDELRNHDHCIYDTSFVDDRDISSSPSLPPGGGHRRRRRRVQFGGFGGHSAGNSRCPLRGFDDRATLVDSACHMGQGLGMPTTCSTACALELKPFWDDCHDLIERFLDDEIDEFDALHAECADKGVRAVLYMVESLDCDATPYHLSNGGRTDSVIADYPANNGETNTVRSCADMCDDTDGCVSFALPADGDTKQCQILSEPPTNVNDPAWEVYSLLPTVPSEGGLYVLVDSPLNWDDARAFCTDRYYDLASIHTEAQAAVVQDLCLRSRIGGGCKVGLHDDSRADVMLDLSGGTGMFSGQYSNFDRIRFLYSVQGATNLGTAATDNRVVLSEQVATRARPCTPSAVRE
eukprot:COSAG02_NODE_3072_length_7424_cov_3.895427_2_plen_1385_part_00